MRLAYLAVTNAFAALRLLPMSDRDKDVEVLVPRHQLAVAQRQLGPARPAFTGADRAFLAALLPAWSRIGCGVAQDRRCCPAVGGAVQPGQGNGGRPCRRSAPARRPDMPSTLEAPRYTVPAGTTHRCENLSPAKAAICSKSWS